MTVMTARAVGTRGERYAADGHVRISFTMPQSVFDDLKATALRNHRSIAEEIRVRVAPPNRKERSMKRKASAQTYAVGTDLCGEAVYEATSMQSARSQAWRAMKLVKPDLSFNAFVKLSTVRKLKSAERAA